MIARRINIRPSVAADFTSGSLAAKTGPNTSPYASMIAPPTRTHETYANQLGHHEVLLINSKAMKTPRAPIAP
jgi:hypothetical protein